MSFKRFLRSRAFFFNIFLSIVVTVALGALTFYLLDVYSHHGQALSIVDFSGLTVEESEQLANEYNLNCKIIDSVYIKRAIPGTVYEQRPIAGYRVKEGRTVYLTLTSRTPEKVRIPNVTDVSLREAKARLESAGLKLGQTQYRHSEYVNLVLGKSIDGIEIQKDTLVEKGSFIDLIVSIGKSNEKVKIPDLKGMTLDEAKNILYDINLNAGALVYDTNEAPVSDTIQALIWRQRPAPEKNGMILLGSSIDIWLTYEPLDVEVPDDIEL